MTKKRSRFLVIHKILIRQQFSAFIFPISLANCFIAQLEFRGHARADKGHSKVSTLVARIVVRVCFAISRGFFAGSLFRSGDPGTHPEPLLREFFTGYSKLGSLTICQWWKYYWFSLSFKFLSVFPTSPFAKIKEPFVDLCPSSPI